MQGAIPHRYFEHVTRGATLTVFRLFDETAPLPLSQPKPRSTRTDRPTKGRFHGSDKLPPEADIGRKIYDRVCVACHGRDLKTTGVAARDLRGFPIAERERFIRSVTHGTGDMPPFGKVLSEDEIEQIYSYVRAVQAAAP
jgi:mono/diheme cytochrome c family protein